ncbi:MAG TPA: iron ABC transporter substrate-binding protein, partial [Methanoregulaceae archaeon]|nr:iron ABC transporter substrate-binding protein [Methanoregulaceae archaeon]
MTKSVYFILSILLVTGLAFVAGCTGTTGQEEQKAPETSSTAKNLSLTDGFSREVTIPFPPQKVVCSGSGCLRYLVYLGGQDLVAGVDDIEKKNQTIEGRPYTLAYGSQFKGLPLIGEFRGKDDPEKISAIAPELIFKTGTTG